MTNYQPEIDHYTLMLSQTPIEMHITRKLIVSKLEKLFQLQHQETPNLPEQHIFNDFHYANAEAVNKLHKPEFHPQPEPPHFKPKFTIPGWDEGEI